ncbi:MAG: TetR family transcriptional regulator [Actinomycetota bacterium]
MATSTTRNDILDAAEVLFSTQGYDGTSVREITRLADVNVAAVHYHFGDKAEVLRGVTDRVVGPLNAQRFDLLDRLLAEADDRPPMVAIVDAFVRPDVDAIRRLGERGPRVAHFLGRVYADRTPWIREMTEAQFVPIGERFVPVLSAAAPHVGPRQLAWRMQRTIAVIVELFASWPDEPMTDDDVTELLDDLVAFLAAGLAAPVGRGGGAPT